MFILDYDKELFDNKIFTTWLTSTNLNFYNSLKSVQVNPANLFVFLVYVRACNPEGASKKISSEGCTKVVKLKPKFYCIV